MLMMSVYRLRAAKTYSSGLRASCLLPSSSCVSTAKNCKTEGQTLTVSLQTHLCLWGMYLIEKEMAQSRKAKLLEWTYAGEQHSSQSSVHDVQNPVTDKDTEKTKDDQDHQTDKQHAGTGGEVILGLQEGDKHPAPSHQAYTDPRSTSQIFTIQLRQTCKEKRTTEKHTTAVMPTAITTESVSWKLAIIPTIYDILRVRMD